MILSLGSGGRWCRDLECGGNPDLSGAPLGETESDITMTDGKSLERVGVVPDELKLPTAADLAAKRDPILAYALSLAGTAVTPEKAGTMFPLEWQK